MPQANRWAGQRRARAWSDRITDEQAYNIMAPRFAANTRARMRSRRGTALGLKRDDLIALPGMYPGAVRRGMEYALFEMGEVWTYSHMHQGFINPPPGSDLANKIIMRSTKSLVKRNDKVLKQAKVSAATRRSANAWDNAQTVVHSAIENARLVEEQERVRALEEGTGS